MIFARITDLSPSFWPDHSRTLRDLFSEACPALSGLSCSGTGLQMRLWIWAPVHCSLHHYRSSSPRCGEVDSSPSGLNRPVFVVIGPFLLFQQMKKSYRTFSDIWMDFFFFFFQSNFQTLLTYCHIFCTSDFLYSGSLQRPESQQKCCRDVFAAGRLCCLSDSRVSTSLNKPFSLWIWPDGRHRYPHTVQYIRNSEEYPYLHSFSRTKYCSGTFRRDICEFACLHFRHLV